MNLKTIPLEVLILIAKKDPEVWGKMSLLRKDFAQYSHENIDDAMKSFSTRIEEDEESYYELPNGMMHGVYTLSDRRIENYRLGQLHGYFQKNHENEKIHVQGIYVNNLREGCWLKWNLWNLKVQETNYFHGKKHGLKRTWYEREWYSEVNYKDDKKNGVYYLYLFNFLFEKGRYKDNELDGFFFSWNKDGKLKDMGLFHQGKKRGLWLTLLEEKVSLEYYVN